VILLSSDSHVTAVEDARKRYGAASQPEKEERLRIRREAKDKKRAVWSCQPVIN